MILLGCMLFFSGALFGQELLTLDNAINRALQKNHQIKVLRNTVKISENNVNVGNAGFLPKLDVVSAANYSDLEMQQTNGTLKQKSTLSSAQIQLSYNLFDGLGSYFTYKNLKAGAEGSALSARQNIELTLLQVIRGYYSVAAAQEGLNIRKEALQISRERLQRIEKKAAYGQANKIDLLNARVDFNADTVAYLNADLQLTEARRALNLLLGQDVNTAFAVEHEVQFLQALSLDDLKASAYENNASYLLAQSNIRQSKYALRQTQSVYSPRLDFTTAYGYSQTATDLDLTLNNPDRSLTAGISLSLNLFNGFKNKIQTQNARIALTNQQILLEQAKLNLEKDLENAYTAYQNKRYILEIEQTSLEAAELNFQRSRELYDLGQLTNTDFRAAQLNLVQAKFSLSQAKYEAKLAEATLLQISGQLIRSSEQR